MAGRARLVAEVLLGAVIIAAYAVWCAFLNLEGKVRCVAVMLWSLVVMPLAVLFFATCHQGVRWVLVCALLAAASASMAVMTAGSWYGDSELREFLTAVPGLTAAALLITAPWLASWTLHDLSGQPTRARVVEAEPVIDEEHEDTGFTRYHLAEAETERDLGWMRFGPRERARSGAVISVSVVPDGWAPPIATERLDDTDVEPGITAFAALATLHLLGCAVTAAAWPREL
ncbi:hypothetical protein ABZX77_40320 [Streptomyces sp. NPDC004237]|uniref:hypothetical protein n=1 Tax=Streptomyces sp. NPDC004237 TaxID=3154455 RepID=UPI0033B559AE